MFTNSSNPLYQHLILADDLIKTICEMQFFMMVSFQFFNPPSGHWRQAKGRN